MNHKHTLALFLSLALLPALLLSCGNKDEAPVRTEAGTQGQTEPEPAETEDPTDYEELAALPFRDLAESPAGDFTFTESDGALTITGYTGSDTKLRIPSSINGKPVTGLADGALRDQTGLTVLWIPDSVTEFGEEILKGCTNLYALHTPLPSDADKAYLGYLYGALDYQPNNVAELRTLEFLELGGTLTTLPSYALYDCNDLGCVRLPESVTALGEFSLYRCESLKYINTEGLRTVGRYAFGHCASLTELTFGACLTELGLGALEYCGSMRRLTLPFVGGSAGENRYLGYVFGAEDPGFSGGFFPSSLREVILLPGCESLGDYAFYECSTLRSVSLGEGLTSIGVRAFSGCSDLRELVLPDSLQTVREHAFSGCSALGSARFGNGLTTLGVQAFLGCTALTEIALPSSLTALPNSCFSGCTSLQTVNLGGVRTVGANAFYGCTALSAVTASGAVDFEQGNELAERLLGG